VKDPIKPYLGECNTCTRRDWLDVGGVCTTCFALMDPIQRSAHLAHVSWVNAGRPVDTSDPWE
jgi:hypothetical protein